MLNAAPCGSATTPIRAYGTSNGGGLRKVDTSRVPLSAWLGVTGMPGHHCVREILKDKGVRKRR